MPNKSVVYIIGYTISNEALRDVFRKLIKDQLHGDGINESSYAVNCSLSVSDMQADLKEKCRQAEEQSKVNFEKDDFVKLYCSGLWANYSDKQYMDKILEYPIV